MTKVNALMTGNVVTIDPDASGHDAVSRHIVGAAACCADVEAIVVSYP